jgi:hypothetical protein
MEGASAGVLAEVVFAGGFFLLNWLLRGMCAAFSLCSDVDQLKEDRKYTAPNSCQLASQSTGLRRYSPMTDHELCHPSHTQGPGDRPVPRLCAIYDAPHSDHGALTPPARARVKGPPARLLAGLRARSR